MEARAHRGRDASPSLSKAKDQQPRKGGDGTRSEIRSRVRLDVDERRAQLVELGLAEFGARTYDEVSIDLIAQTAGISKGLLYHYFPTKRAFYIACVREAAARLLARMDMPIDMPDHANGRTSEIELLDVGLDRYLEYVRRHGGAFATLMRSGVGADRELAAVVDETRASLLERLTSGMAGILPMTNEPSSPLLPIALRGFIGLAEATSIAWVEACVEAETRAASDARRGSTRAKTVPSRSEVRDLLAQALIAILRSAAHR